VLVFLVLVCKRKTVRRVRNRLRITCSPMLYSDGSAGVPGVGVQEEDSVEGEEQIKDYVLTCALF
jgi:hypothetical protein